MIALFISLSFAPPRPQQLPPYAVSIRCAGLAEAGTILPTLKHREPELFDVAMFWGMAASERAQKDGISGTAFTKDQQLAKLQAARDLASRPQALEELDLCVRQAQAFSVK